jgi:hypothetical protein
MKKYLKYLYMFFHFHKWEVVYWEIDKYTGLKLDKYETCHCGLTRKKERDFGHGSDMGYGAVKHYWNDKIKKELLIKKLMG